MVAQLERKRSKRVAKKRVRRSDADPHDLYERSVQDPDGDTAILARLFRRFRRREPVSLREDFCGTATLSTHWARSHRHRWAVGVDLDGPTLRWGERRHLQSIGPELRRRVTLLEGNVLDGLGPRTDIGCALNFSYSVFKTRDALRGYFAAARDKLVRDGVFVLDAWGGWGVVRPDLDRRKVDDFIYEWERARFDPLTNEILCYIHFELAGGARIDRAFTYDWRLWSVQELRELLLEAGFRRVHALWERTDADGEGTGVYWEPVHTENQELWWTYVVAER